MVSAALVGILISVVHSTLPPRSIPNPWSLPGKVFTVEAVDWKALVSFCDINGENEAELVFAGPGGNTIRAVVPYRSEIRRHFSRDGLNGTFIEECLIHLLWDENTEAIGGKELNQFLHGAGLMDQDDSFIDTLEYGYDPEDAGDSASRKEVIVAVDLIDDLDTLTETKVASDFCESFRDSMLAYALSHVLSGHRRNLRP
ncbi:hypothetical protein FOL47_010588 [Perkinsus chesapeaki]|uniref:Uncharacterized protein n=1 Tax=Perkinsus chesapeaki TaxID=330153 RepID=A0A7J6MPV9_PERCH|nr:hypothetical protein FOL47_010588 [Perkinsus chesapeaki]